MINFDFEKIMGQGVPHMASFVHYIKNSFRYTERLYATWLSYY